MKLQWCTVSWNRGSLCPIYFSKNACSSLFCSFGFIWSHFESKTIYIHKIHLYLTFPCFLQASCGQLFWNQWCSRATPDLFHVVLLDLALSLPPVHLCTSDSHIFTFKFPCVVFLPITISKALSLAFKHSESIKPCSPWWHHKRTFQSIQKKLKTPFLIYFVNTNCVTGLRDIIDIYFLQNKVSRGISCSFFCHFRDAPFPTCSEIEFLPVSVTWSHLPLHLVPSFSLLPQCTSTYQPFPLSHLSDCSPSLWSHTSLWWTATNGDMGKC